VTSQYGMMLKKVVVLYFTVLSRYLLGDTEENHK